jgi:hypothetical protein
VIGELVAAGFDHQLVTGDLFGFAMHLDVELLFQQMLQHQVQFVGGAGAV